MLKVSDLTVRYGTTPVVHGVDFTLAADEVLTLVGPTGCGKTTILHALAGLRPLAAGRIELGAWSASPDHIVPPEQRNVGMVFQDFALFPHLSVLDNVAFRVRERAIAELWIERLGLSDLREAKPERLSGGQKQRVALARTLAHEPALVLLDEPLSNLDAALKRTLRWEIRDALKAASVPAVWVTHDQQEALGVGDRVGVLREGRLEQLAPPGSCFETPANRFVAAFLGDATFLPGTIAGDRVETELGALDVLPGAPETGPVDVLLRPGDLELSGADEDGACLGTVCWVRYEGTTRLYAIRLRNGVELELRTHSDSAFAPSERVALRVREGRRFTCFSSDARP